MPRIKELVQDTKVQAHRKGAYLSYKTFLPRFVIDVLGLEVGSKVCWKVKEGKVWVEKSKAVFR